MSKRPTSARCGPSEGELTPRQQKAITALMTCSTVLEAAEMANIPYRTLKRWLGENAEFKAAYQEATDSAFSDALQTLRRSALIAADTLAEVMADKTQPATARVTAARTTLELAARAQERTENAPARVIIIDDI